MPIAAGILNSLHLIAICELAPPNLVINPLILKSNLLDQHFQLILFFCLKEIFLTFELFEICVILENTFFSPIKFGDDT